MHAMRCLRRRTGRDDVIEDKQNEVALCFSMLASAGAATHIGSSLCWAYGLLYRREFAHQPEFRRPSREHMSSGPSASAHTQ